MFYKKGFKSSLPPRPFLIPPFQPYYLLHTRATTQSIHPAGRRRDRSIRPLGHILQSRPQSNLANIATAFHFSSAAGQHWTARSYQPHGVHSDIWNRILSFEVRHPHLLGVLAGPDGHTSAVLTTPRRISRNLTDKHDPTLQPLRLEQDVFWKVMENSPRGTESKDFSHSQPEHIPKMSMIAMATPTPHAPFRRDFWDEARSTDYALSRPRSDADRIALPSIRQVIHSTPSPSLFQDSVTDLAQAIPELQLRIAPQDGTTRTPGSATSPTVPAPGVLTPEYVHSPNSNKRRRLSIDDERDERVSRVPRLYNSPPRAMERSVHGPPSPGFAPRAAPEQWGPSSRTSPHMPPGGLPAIRSPAAMEPAADRPDARPALPSFPPPMSLERGPHPVPRMRGHSSDDYLQEAPRPLYVHPADPRYDAASYRPAPPYSYGYHHPSRLQSLSLGAIHPLDRSPFSTVGYGPHYGEYMRFGEMGMGMSGDNKQRKRRGNLPKETTDKLRAWFVAHLNHPYPTEDEKQELMRQTGLQMSK